jgi:hypothetical protein
LSHDFEIGSYEYIGSSIGNAYFSGVSYAQLWDCILMAQNREELDAAVDITIKMNNIYVGRQNDRILPKKYKK